MDPGTSAASSPAHSVLDQSVHTIIASVLLFLDQDTTFIERFLQKEFESSKDLVDTANALTVVVRTH